MPIVKEHLENNLSARDLRVAHGNLDSSPGTVTAMGRLRVAIALRVDGAETSGASDTIVEYADVPARNNLAESAILRVSHFHVILVEEK